MRKSAILQISFYFTPSNYERKPSLTYTCVVRDNPHSLAIRRFSSVLHYFFTSPLGIPIQFSLKDFFSLILFKFYTPKHYLISVLPCPLYKPRKVLSSRFQMHKAAYQYNRRIHQNRHILTRQGQYCST